MSSIISLSIVAGLVFYLLTEADERRRILGDGVALLRYAATEVIRRMIGRRADGEAVQPRPFATWCLAVLNVGVFVVMLFGRGALGDPQTLVSWGGSVGPRTTNGEWWRLVSATFVHGGVVHLLATLVGLIQIATLTERVVGPFALASVYVGAGALANLVCLFTSPVSVAAGGSGAVFGVLGLFTATWTWSVLRGSRVRIGWRAAKRLAPAVALFLLYVVVAGRFDRGAVVAAFTGGTINGLLAARGARDHRPAAGKVAALTAVTAALILVCAAPVRGIADVRPQIERVLAMEDRIAKSYDGEVARFTNGAISAGALARTIEQTILPELQAESAALARLERVPREHQPLVALAGEYLHLSDESWRVRSTALRKSAMRMLQDADRLHLQAVESLRKIKDLMRT